LLAGVTTGMADAFHIDVVVMRVIWVIATIATGGLGIPAYLICWIAFPSDENPAPMEELRNRNYNAAAIAGVAALALGFVILSSQFVNVRPFRNGGVGVAVVLIGGGLAVLFLRHPDRNDDDSDHTPPSGRAETPTTPDAPETPDATPPADDAATAETPTTTPLTTTTSTAWSQHSPWPAPPAPPDRGRWSRPRAPRPPRPPRRRSFLTPLTISVLLIGAGAAALLDSVGAVHLTLAAVLASALIVVGGALVLSGWFGRARGLIPIGVLLLLATIPASVIDVPITGGIGERRYHPVARTELRRTYELGIGHLVVDLRDTPLSHRVTTVTGSLGIGELDIDVPAGVRVDVTAHAGAGATEIFGHLDDGVSEDTHRVAGVRQPGVLRLDLRVGAGSIHVRRWSANGALLPS
jgi:phage shock protein PspC (stress-responsive transcriptional regulator)